MTSILISGWRGIAHSYAVVNQFQCLELLRRPEIKLFFEDVPFINSHWNTSTGLFSPEDEKRIHDIPPLPDGLIPDVEFRIAYPYDLSTPPRGRKLAVFATSEYKTVEDGAVLGDLSNDRAMIVTTSEWSRDGLRRAGAQRIEIVPPGVDKSILRPFSEIQRQGARSAMGFADDDVVFLNIGAMNRDKNPEMLIRAFAGVLAKHPQARLILKGNDDLYHSYELFKTAMSASLDRLAMVLPRLTYIGQSMSFAGMASLYHAADCYVTPYSAEGFNMPALEAAACGLPLICTAGGPTDEFTDPSFARRIRSDEMVESHHGVEKTLLRPDAGHLEDLMIEMVNDEEFRRSAREAGPRHVGENYTWRHAVDKLLDVLG